MKLKDMYDDAKRLADEFARLPRDSTKALAVFDAFDQIMVECAVYEAMGLKEEDELPDASNDRINVPVLENHFQKKNC